MPEHNRDGWDKAEILLRPVGGFFTAAAVAAVGYFGSNVLEERQIIETNAQLYAELMSNREAADSNLRKDMFNSIITTFLKAPSKEQIEQQVLNLELLAYNFHDALDLGPLFKHVYEKIQGATQLAGKDRYIERLERVAKEVTTKQIAALEESGAILDGTVFFDELDERLEGVTAIEDTELDIIEDKELDNRKFRLDVLHADKKKKEVRVQLTIQTKNENGGWDEITPIFRVGFFDFPMIDNTRLSSGQRCAIVLRDFDQSGVGLTLVYFPGSRASLKEKPYYDEVIRDLLRSREALERNP